MTQREIRTTIGGLLGGLVQVLGPDRVPLLRAILRQWVESDVVWVGLAAIAEQTRGLPPTLPDIKEGN